MLGWLSCTQCSSASMLLPAQLRAHLLSLAGGAPCYVSTPRFTPCFLCCCQAPAVHACSACGFSITAATQPVWFALLSTTHTFSHFSEPNLLVLILDSLCTLSSSSLSRVTSCSFRASATWSRGNRGLRGALPPETSGWFLHFVTWPNFEGQEKRRP